MRKMNAKNDIRMDVPYVLAGDIGGTRSRLALFTRAGGFRKPVAAKEYASASFPDLESLVSAFLGEQRAPVGRACFGVAGPVRDGRAVLTNLPWVVDEKTLGTRLGLDDVRVINDVAALADAVPLLAGGDSASLQEGRPVPGGTIAVVSVGTGLGAAFLTWDGSRYRVFPSEAGHGDFAPADSRQARLFLFVRKRFGHASRERVCSGTGIGLLYEYLKAEGFAEETEEFGQAIAATADPVPRILAAALDEQRPCPLCRGALELFVSILGALCGSLALDFLATGGIFLGGGIPPRILPWLQGKSFLAAFRSKGRLEAWMAEIPVHVILDPLAALRGAAREALAVSPPGRGSGRRGNRSRNSR